MYLSLGGIKEAANRIGFGVTVAVEGPGSDALVSGFGVDISLLSNYPNANAKSFCVGRITVDAREKD